MVDRSTKTRKDVFLRPVPLWGTKGRGFDIGFSFSVGLMGRYPSGHICIIYHMREKEGGRKGVPVSR